MILSHTCVFTAGRLFTQDFVATCLLLSGRGKWTDFILMKDARPVFFSNRLSKMVSVTVDVSCYCSYRFIHISMQVVVWCCFVITLKLYLLLALFLFLQVFMPVHTGVSQELKLQLPLLDWCLLDSFKFVGLIKGRGENERTLVYIHNEEGKIKSGLHAQNLLEFWGR